MKKQALFLVIASLFSLGIGQTASAGDSSSVVFKLSGSVGFVNEIGIQRTRYPLQAGSPYSFKDTSDYWPQKEFVTERIPYGFKLSGTSLQISATKPLLEGFTAFFKTTTKIDYKQGTIKAALGNSYAAFGVKTPDWGTFSFGYQDPAQADLLYYPYSKNNAGEDTIGKMDGGYAKTVMIKDEVEVGNGVTAGISYSGNLYDDHNFSIGVLSDQPSIKSSAGFTITSDTVKGIQWSATASAGYQSDNVEVFAVSAFTNSLEASDTFIGNYIYTDNNRLFSSNLVGNKPFKFSYIPGKPLSGCDPLKGGATTDSFSGGVVCSNPKVYNVEDTTKLFSFGAVLGAIFNTGKDSTVSIALQYGYTKADISLNAGNTKKYPTSESRRGLSVTATARMYSYGAKIQFDTKILKDINLYVYGAAATGNGSIENFEYQQEMKKNGYPNPQKMSSETIILGGLGLKMKF